MADSTSARMMLADATLNEPSLEHIWADQGYRGETASVEAMRKRVEWDLEYLRNWSLSLDLRIIMKTVTTMFSDDMAY